jgi:hypothetical protein
MATLFNAAVSTRDLTVVEHCLTDGYRPTINDLMGAMYETFEINGDLSFRFRQAPVIFERIAAKISDSEISGAVEMVLRFQQQVQNVLGRMRNEIVTRLDNGLPGTRIEPGLGAEHLGFGG